MIEGRYLQSIHTAPAFESGENTTVSANILCLAVCAGEVRSKAGTCDTSVHYTMSQPFSPLHCEEQPIWLHPEELKFKAKQYLSCINIDRLNYIKPANANICKYSLS